MNTTANRKKLYVRIFWITISVPLFIFVLLLLLVATGNLGFMPTFEDLENPDSNLASEVISDDHVILGSYYFQNRTFVGFNEINPDLIDALISTEDIRFYRHSGIDFRGLARVFFKTIIIGDKSAGGGSTITQQLAKNLFPRDTIAYSNAISKGFKLVKIKFKEWVTAAKLERAYSKNEILTMYLNQFDFLYHAVGIKSAARVYFNTTPDSLTLEEGAMLVGMVKNPSYYNPLRNKELALFRRNVVLSQMRKYDYITAAEFDTLVKKPLVVDYQKVDHNEGPATYFREYLRLTLGAKEPQRKNYLLYADYAADSSKWVTNPLYGWCNKNYKPDGTQYNLYRDGLRIHTTLNSRMQRYAEDAIKEHIGSFLQPAFNKEKHNRKRGPFSRNLTDKQIDQIMNVAMRRTERYRRLRNEGISMDKIMKIFNTPVKMTVFTWQGDKDTTMTPMDSILFFKFYLRAGFVSMDPHNGYIKAYAGGPSFRYFKYDPVSTQRRQVGSTIKPFLYTLAMQEGYSPCDLVPNVPTTFEVNDTVWIPKNSGSTKMDGKMVTLKWGLANSVNWISAYLMKRLNPESVIEVMRKMGIKSHLDPVPSLFLGTSDISLEEMVAAYCTFANKGVYTEPLFVTRIEDKNGNTLQIFKNQMNEAISEETAYLMEVLLKGVVEQGTAVRLRYRFNLLQEIGGKTGTTQNHSDGWFIGITPDLVSGVWVGGEDRDIHFDGITLGQGAEMALPVWALYMQDVYADKLIKLSQDPFVKPENFNRIINCTGFESQNQNLYPGVNETFDEGGYGPIL